MDAKNEMIRKGGTLLDACEVITVASVDGKGYPRPVPVVKLAAEGCGQIWFATGAGSRKTAQFRANPKAGVSFFAGQDSVVLTGFIEEVPILHDVLSGRIGCWSISRWGRTIPNIAC